MSDNALIASFQYSTGNIDQVLEFLKRTRNELRILRKVRVWTERVQIFDVNGNFFEIGGIGFGDPDIVPLLQAINTPFKPEMIHQPITAPFKEFNTGRRYPWAEDRVM